METEQGNSSSIEIPLGRIWPLGTVCSSRKNNSFSLQDCSYYAQRCGWSVFVPLCQREWETSQSKILRKNTMYERFWHQLSSILGQIWQAIKQPTCLDTNCCFERALRWFVVGAIGSLERKRHSPKPNRSKQQAVVDWSSQGDGKTRMATKGDAGYWM